jgi:lipopolysaccharide/colanic/teichoic acid biosynthesis glycosyltransferase
MKNKGLYEKHLKRLLDFTLAFVGLLVLAPVMLVEVVK